MEKQPDDHNAGLSFDDFRKEVLDDYGLAILSRNLSITGRKEVLTGKAKFGIFGDGKEIAQIAFAKQFSDGDWRSGYYRDQTFMMAAGLFTAREFFSQLYGDTDPKLNPSNAGRSFNNHFATRSLNEDGTWRNLMKQKNSSADISPTAGQMPRLLGLAYASVLFRNITDLHRLTSLTSKGSEVAFGTIGDASTSEGHFWETINAAAVLQVPVALAVWDDGYGISVPREYQTARGSISEALKGFERAGSDKGIVIMKGRGWDYPELCRIFAEGVDICRREHVPVVFHIDEMTQPLGHSTSGSHERYKSAERLEWEKNFDPIRKMREWIVSSEIATEEELDGIDARMQEEVRDAKRDAWKEYTRPMLVERDALVKIIDNRSCLCKRESYDKPGTITGELRKIIAPIRKDNISAARKILRHVCADCEIREKLQADLTNWLKRNGEDNAERYNTHLYNESQFSALNVEGVPAVFSEGSPELPGREVLRDFWDAALAKDPRIFIFGEDTGNIGGVNQSYEGLQKKYGGLRVADTGIRETTILGQGIGMALRGLRPVAEIQYLDYLLYALQTFSDDLATTHYRTRGGQTAPVIVVTRGHRLEGIWHAGSPVSMIINSIRGVYVCVPRNMTQATGFYNTLLKGEDPAIVIEPLNGYRLRERRPDNLGEFSIPLGVPEILCDGEDITIVTYGSCVRIALEAAGQLRDFDISAELIDVQTLLPFDRPDLILESLKKTGRIIFFDEDVPGGGTAYMMQQIIEERGGFYYLDAEPQTLSGKDHRTAYTTDGDYFSNPNAEDLFEMAYAMMHRSDPVKYPRLF
ncbi:MAG: transketolase [Marinilabiliales bacterium]|nr:MAG: transketolase [Marinilabiliales bacterium]